VRHQLRLAGWALLLGVALPTTSWGAAWLPSNTISGSGKTATWTELADVNSGVLTCVYGCVCDNTSVNDTFTVFRATKAGVIITSDYWKTDATKNCSDTTSDYCATVVLPAGNYIFDPTSTGATAECRGDQVTP